MKLTSYLSHLLSFGTVALALGAVACSSDSNADDDASGNDCEVEVTYSDAAGNAETTDEKICKKLPSECNADSVCSTDACDAALQAFCDEGTTRNACGSVSVGDNLTVSINCQRNP